MPDKLLPLGSFQSVDPKVCAHLQGVWEPHSLLSALMFSGIPPTALHLSAGRDLTADTLKAGRVCSFSLFLLPGFIRKSLSFHNSFLIAFKTASVIHCRSLG